MLTLEEQIERVADVATTQAVADARASERRVPTRESARATRWMGVAAAVLVVAMVGGLVWMVTERTEPPAATNAPTSAASWTPPGMEFALADLGPASKSPIGRPVVADLSRQVGIEGHPPHVITRLLAYAGNATPVEQTCTSENGSSGCRPEWNTASWSTSVTSSVDNGFATFDLWTIEGLPDTAAYVSYTDGTRQLWQRPIAGFSAFPNVDGNDEIVIAYDATGSEVGRFGGEQEDTIESTDQTPPLADISRSELEEFSELTDDEMRRCLTTQGATFDGNVATFTSDVDQGAIWTQCVAEVKQFVGDAVGELDPRFYDPATERPENSDPAHVFID